MTEPNGKINKDSGNRNGKSAAKILNSYETKNAHSLHYLVTPLKRVNTDKVQRLSGDRSMQIGLRYSLAPSERMYMD